MAGDVTHTILAVEDRGLPLHVEERTTTPVVVVVAVVVVVVVGTTTRGITAALAVVVAVEEGQGALKVIVLHRLQEDTRMTGTDSMVTMEGGVEKPMAIGMDTVPLLPSMSTDRVCTQLLSHALSQAHTGKRKSGSSAWFRKFENDLRTL
jgi:hypothetical protein